MPEPVPPECPKCKQPMEKILAPLDVNWRVESRDFYCRKHDVWDERLYCPTHQQELSIKSESVHPVGVGDNKVGFQRHTIYKCPASSCNFSPTRITRAGQQE